MWTEQHGIVSMQCKVLLTMTQSKTQNWFKQVLIFFFYDTSSTTRPHYVIVENGANSPGRAADGRAQQSGWQSTETAAPN